MKNIALATLALVIGLPWTAFAGEDGGQRGPVLYDPAEKTAIARTAPERTVHRHALAESGVVLVAGEPTAARLPWDDRQRPELFRIYFTR